MGISKEEVIKQLLKRTKYYSLFLVLNPNVPYIVCDPETLNDQVHVFAKEKEAKAFCEEAKTRKDMVYVKEIISREITRKDLNRKEKFFIFSLTMGPKDTDNKQNAPAANFYETLHGVGVNAIVWHDGEETCEIELSDFFNPDFSKLPENVRPLINQSLQISAIYYLEEARRNNNIQQNEELQSLSEELTANIKKSEYFVLIRKGEVKDGKQKILPWLITRQMQNSKTGEVVKQNCLAACSDTRELNWMMRLLKLDQNKDAGFLKIPFAQMAGMIQGPIPMCILNPMGINLTIDQNMARALTGQRVMQVVPQNKNGQSGAAGKKVNVILEDQNTDDGQE